MGSQKSPKHSFLDKNLDIIMGENVVGRAGSRRFIGR